MSYPLSVACKTTDVRESAQRLSVHVVGTAVDWQGGEWSAFLWVGTQFGIQLGHSEGRPNRPV
jgi:hypothetical protein